MYTRLELSTLGQNHLSSAENAVTDSEREYSGLEIQYRNLYTCPTYGSVYVELKDVRIRTGHHARNRTRCLGRRRLRALRLCECHGAHSSLLRRSHRCLGRGWIPTDGSSTTGRLRNRPAGGARSAGIDAWTPGHYRIANGWSGRIDYRGRLTGYDDRYLSRPSRRYDTVHPR